ncbi:two-component system [Streptomyces sp. NL15-2K]|nr:hypothetical protein [Kutzneria buriramensis]WKX07654.1 hypothetical protein Q4V64_09235 [Kutzneria buriramensis]GCB51075.1 two-component system [Streptomyces sp. NL15-2K]
MVFTFAFPVVFLFLFASIFRDDVQGAGITASQLYVPAMMAAGIMSTSFQSLGISKWMCQVRPDRSSVAPVLPPEGQQAQHRSSDAPRPQHQGDPPELPASGLLQDLRRLRQEHPAQAGTPGWPVRAVAAGLLVLLIPLFVRVGRPLLRADPPEARQALGYLAAAMALFLPSAILVGETRLMTFALVPQCFMTLRMRWALVAVAVINLAPVVGWALLWWPSDEAVFFNGLFAVVTLGFSVAVGTWVIRIIEQSQERAELIAELDASRHEVSRLSAEHGALEERERMAREILPHSLKGMGDPHHARAGLHQPADADPGRGGGNRP